MAVLLLLVRYLKTRPAAPVPAPSSDTRRPKVAEPEAATGFNRTVVLLKFSRHARCRMACRHIDESEIREIMQKGTVNTGKSALSDPLHPKYAIEGVTHDRQRVRVVFAQEATQTTVVTVIDLDTEWKCAC